LRESALSDARKRHAPQCPGPPCAPAALESHPVVSSVSTRHPVFDIPRRHRIHLIVRLELPRQDLVSRSAPSTPHSRLPASRSPTSRLMLITRPHRPFNIDPIAACVIRTRPSVGVRHRPSPCASCAAQNVRVIPIVHQCPPSKTEHHGLHAFLNGSFAAHIQRKQCPRRRRVSPLGGTTRLISAPPPPASLHSGAQDRRPRSANAKTRPQSLRRSRHHATRPTSFPCPPFDPRHDYTKGKFSAMYAGPTIMLPVPYALHPCYCGLPKSRSKQKPVARRQKRRLRVAGRRAKYLAMYVFWCVDAELTSPLPRTRRDLNDIVVGRI